MSLFAEAYERIKFATHTRTQVEMAEVLDIRQSSISDAKRRNSVPADWYMKLFEKFGLNPDWLKQGIGPMYLRTEHGYVPQEGPRDGEESAYYRDGAAKSVICTVHGMACEYTGKGRPELPAVGKLALPLSCLRDHVLVMRMEARNMEPLLCEGAYLGVDASAVHPVSGTIYALYAPSEGVIVRRVFLDGKQQDYLLRSESGMFPETRLSSAELERRLLGRVIWVLQDL